MRLGLLLSLAVLLSGCASDADTTDPSRPAADEETSPDTSFEEYQTPWETADVAWVSNPRNPSGQGASAGALMAIVPETAEPNRTILYNVTLIVGSGLSFRVWKDDVEIASMPLALGENRLEVLADEAARYSYDFPAESAGAGSIRVAIALRGKLPAE